MKYYIDIDNTITKTPYNPNDAEVTAGIIAYKSAVPIPERIEKINRLYDQGHTIVYWTGRGTVSGTHYGEITEMQLKEWGAKYHEILHGKPDFSLMVDDKAVNSEMFFRRQRIGLVINNVIRDYIGKVAEVYTKYTGNDPILPINPYHLELSFPLQNEEFSDIYQWIYYGACLEIFGSANQTKTNLLARISNFQTKIEDRIILLSKETSRSKIATLSFLSKNQFDLSEVIFVDGYADYWNYADVIITDNPEIIRAMPEGKGIIVLKNEHNTEFHTDYETIDSPEDIFTIKDLYTFKPTKPEELIHITGQITDDDDVVMDNPEELVVEGAQPVKVDDAKVQIIDGVPVLNLSEISSDDRGVPPNVLHD